MEKQKGFVTLASLILAALTGLGGIGAVIFVNGHALQGILNARLAVSKNEEAAEHAAVLGFTIADVTPTPTGTQQVTPTPTPTPSVSPTPTPSVTISPTPGKEHDEDSDELEDDDDLDDANEHGGLQIQSQLEFETHGKSEAHGERD